MGKRKNNKKKSQGASHNNATGKTAASKNDKLKGNISFVVGIISLLIALPGTFFNVENKPSISFKIILSLLIIASSGFGIFFFRSEKSTSSKEKSIQNNLTFFSKILLVCGIGFLVTSVVQSKQIPTGIPGAESSSVDFNNSSQQYETSMEQALVQAEFYYDGRMYEQLIELYSSELLRENPIALSNLGYMYSKGIHFEKNHEVALQYYELAAGKGLKEAVHNLISLKLHNCKTFEEVVVTLEQGFDFGDYNTLLFLGSILCGKELSETATELIEDTFMADIESFFTLDSEAQSDILSDSLGPWELTTKVSSQTAQRSTSIYERFTSLGTTTVTTGMYSYTTMFNYLKYTRTFLYDNFMQEQFIFTIK